jgi:type I restriction enzyme S subunit
VTTLPAGWGELAFEAAFSDVTGGQAKTKARDYQDAGLVPIVDQGRELIGGFTDDPDAAFRGPLPVIGFGDHTKVVKYVDFAFGIGADGLKVLRPSSELDPKFAFRVLRSIHLPDGGYDRHFKYLKRARVPVPPLEKQRRIAAILDKADELRAKRRAALEQLDTLTQAIFLDMFRDRLGGTAQDDWISLNELIDPERPICYGILKPGPDLDRGVPYVRVVDMRDGGIDHSSVRRTSDQIDHQYRRSRLRSGDLLMSIRGHVGRLALVPEELDGANITQDSARVAIAQGEPLFVMEYLRTPLAQRWMQRNTKGVAVRGINIGDVRRIPVPDVALADQQRFVCIAKSAIKTCAATRAAAQRDEELFHSLQSRAFCGEL